MTDELDLDDVLAELHSDMRATMLPVSADDVRASYAAIGDVLADALMLDPEVGHWEQWTAVKAAHEAMWNAMTHAGRSADIDPDVSAEVCHAAAIALTWLSSRIDRFDEDRRDAKMILGGD